MQNSGNLSVIYFIFIMGVYYVYSGLYKCLDTYTIGSKLIISKVYRIFLYEQYILR